MTSDEQAVERAALALLEASADLGDAEKIAWIDAQARQPLAVRERAKALLSVAQRLSIATGGAREDSSDHPPPQHVGGYRIVSQIGRGGMGAVYRGERDRGDFAHVAAIKLIKPGLLNAALKERFRTERQTLANLSHPNIAQLFDGGETADGTPYIIMELVDGRSLKQWVDEHGADRAVRLRIFTTACRAVGFAHRNLVVHRDITPSNVLVTPDGTVKLIDFGIAKPPDPDEIREEADASSIGSLSLTPGYAAPERMASSIVTTAADIFSLGKLLAWLIPDQDAECRAIIARATASDPTARYATADDLAEDVEAWADGRPVAAMAGGRHYVAAKFIRRNRLPLAGASLALIALIGALVFALVANHRAQIARAEAEQRFNQTREIANTMMFDVYDQVSATPGSTLARMTLAKASLRYLDALAAIPTAPFAVRVDAGRGYARLAQVIGSGSVATLGHMADAEKLEAKGQALLEQALREQPDDRETRKAMGALMVDRAGSLLYNLNDTKGAFQASARALQLVAPLGDDDAVAARIHLTALTSEGEALSWNLDWIGAEKRYRAAEAYYRQLLRAVRQDTKVRRRHGANLKLLGEALSKQGRNDEMRAVLNQAVEVQEQLLAENPRDPGILLSVVSANRQRAISLRDIHLDAPALRSITRAVEVARQLRDADPDDATASHIWLIALEPQAQMFADAGRRDAAFAAMATMDREYRRLIKVAGDVAGMRRSYSAALNTMAGNYYNLQAYDRACATWRTAKSQLDWVAAHGSVTGTDRDALKNIGQYLLKNCENGPPRAGMDEDV